MPHKRVNPDLSWVFLANFLLLVMVIVLLSLTPANAQAAGKYAHYRHHGQSHIPLNDLAVTPGEATNATQHDLCSAAFHTATVRAVSQSTKHAVCRAYGLSPARCTGKKVEIDHLISLELGGSNDQKNLWPEPYSPRPGAREKDVLENKLHRLICAGAISLTDAQECIAKDWMECFTRTKALK